MFDVVLLFQFTLIANDKLKMTRFVKHFDNLSFGISAALKILFTQSIVLKLLPNMSAAALSTKYKSQVFVVVLLVVV